MERLRALVNDAAVRSPSQNYQHQQKDEVTVEEPELPSPMAIGYKSNSLPQLEEQLESATETITTATIPLAEETLPVVGDNEDSNIGASGGHKPPHLPQQSSGKPIDNISYNGALENTADSNSESSGSAAEKSKAAAKVSYNRTVFINFIIVIKINNVLLKIDENKLKSLFCLVVYKTKFLVHSVVWVCTVQRV